MSKLTAFLISCLIYFLVVTLFILLSYFFVNNKEVVDYGNNDINILFVKEESNEQNDIKQDYTKEVATKQNDSLKNTDNENTTNNELKDNIENSEPSIDDLFGELDIKEPVKKVEKQDTNKITKEDIEKLKSIKESFSNTTVKSSNNFVDTKTSAKSSGIYDEYFGRVNAYLKNKWSLITADANGIDDKEIFEISFKISKNGIIKIQDYGFSENSVLRKKAKIFITLVNEENKNLGIPPNQKDYNGTLRLSVILNVKEIR